MNTLSAEEKITDLIRRRHSTRTYEKRRLEPSLIEGITRLVNGLGAAPFGSSIRFSIAAASEGDTDTLRGLGTYGFIKNPAGFFIGAMRDSERNHEDYGYLMERLVLGATSLGLGTCWLGGGFTQSTFAERIRCAADERVPAVIALGYPADRMRMMERVARWKIDADNRLPWAELFFEEQPGRPLPREAAGAYLLPLEMLRLAPSAVNYQPWRVIKDKGTGVLRLFLARTKNYGEKSFMIKSDIQRIDMGIAMAHFELAALESGLTGRWEAEPSLEGTVRDGLTYTATWRSGT